MAYGKKERKKKARNRARRMKKYYDRQAQKGKKKIVEKNNA